MSEASDYAPKEKEPTDLSAAQVATYGVQAAEYVDKHADDLERMIGQVVVELRQFAADLRSQCQAQARRSEKIVARVRTAAFGVRDMRNAFAQPLTVDDPVDDQLSLAMEQVEDDVRKIAQQFAPKETGATL
jgi:hypothetical protein